MSNVWYDGALPAKLWNEQEKRYIPVLVYHDEYLSLVDHEVRPLADVLRPDDMSEDDVIIEYGWDVLDWSRLR